MKSRTIDPATKDYVRAGGGRATTTTLATSLYHAFRCRRGVWPGDADRGSYFWRLARGNLGPGFKAAAENAGRQAVGPFLEEGLARDFRIEVDTTSAPKRGIVACSIVDVQAGAVDLTDVTRFEE